MNLKCEIGYIIGAGTAGVWTISAENEAGGWKNRTTVLEDMDLAIRGSLKSWKFVYISVLKVTLNQKRKRKRKNPSKI
jgi:hypothetical protein